MAKKAVASLQTGSKRLTTRVATGEDQRAGRWRGKEKEECGIHFVDGKIVRAPATKEML